MMMCGETGMLLSGLLGLSLLLGFAYIIMVLASKESGMVKLVGQIIAAAIAIIAVVMALQCGTMHRHSCGMMDKGMMGKDGDKMMQEMMKKHPEMQKMMMEKMGK